MIFNQTVKDGTQIFEGILFFKAHKQYKNKQITLLLEAICFFLYCLHAFRGKPLLQSYKYKNKQINQLLDVISLCIVCNFEEEDSLKNLHSVLFRAIKKLSV